MAAPQTDSLLNLYLTHRGKLVSYAANITGDRGAAEDIVQEAWTRIGAAARCCAMDEPVGYLYRIVRNLALDGRRRRNFEQRHFIEGVDDEAAQACAEAPTPEDATLARDELRLVMQALEDMPERTRIAVEMHRLGGAKLKDIATRLGVSVTTAHALVAEGVALCHARMRR